MSKDNAFFSILHAIGNDGTHELPKISRVEMIDHTKPWDAGGGRVTVIDYRNQSDVVIAISLQDDGRTLKVFVNRKGE